MGAGDWQDAGQGWCGREAELRLEGWSRQRRVILLRRRLKDAVGMTVLPTAAGRAALGRSQGRLGVVGVRRADRQLPRPRDPLAGSALPGSRRQRKSLRRVEEPLGLGRFHHPRPEALPDHRPPDRARLQLVDAVRAAGRSRPSPRGPDQPPSAAAWYRPPDPPCRPDPLDHHRSAAVTRRSGRSAELPRSSKTCAKLRSSRPSPNAGAASSAKHSSSISTADNCGSPLGYRPDETTICDCEPPEPAQVATSQLLNLG